jgi:hypothetical protein
MAAAHERSEAPREVAVARLPRGVFEAEDFIDEDGRATDRSGSASASRSTASASVADFTGTPSAGARARELHARAVWSPAFEPSSRRSRIRTNPARTRWFRPFEVSAPGHDLHG